MAVGVTVEQLAFVVCCMINLVDLMGMAFTGPVLLPYGRILGATTAQIASFQTVRFAVGIVSMVWMPRFADKKGIKLCLLISIAGSGVAYAIQGSAHLFAVCDTVRHAIPPDGQATAILGVKPGTCAFVGGAGNHTAAFFAHNSSAIATEAGGILECEEDCKTQVGIIVMIAGRAVSGLFAGTQPVLRSFVTRLSLPNVATLKFRMTVLFASSQAGGLALAPIAGLIGRWGMHLPWYVSTVVAALVLVFASVCFENPEGIKAQQNQELEKKIGPPPSEEGGAASGGEAAAAAPPDQGSSEVPPWKGPSPGRDKILYTLVVCYVFIFSTVSALGILIPLLLEYPEYGLVDPDSEARTQENLASGTALVGVPFGVCNLLCSTAVFLIVSARIGDRNTLRLGETICMVCFCLYGYGTSRFWQLTLLHGLCGCGIGLLVPAVGPTLQQYNYQAHPDKLAQASAMPMFGLTGGMVIGPMAYVAILGEGQDRARMNTAWLVAGACFVVAFVLMEAAFTMIERHPAMKRLQMTPREIRIALESNAMDKDEFIEEMVTFLRSMLTKGHPQYRNLNLWNGNVQKIVRRILNDAYPKLREFNEEAGGKEYLEDVASWLAAQGTQQEQDAFRQRFPHIPLQSSRQLEAMHGGYVAGGGLDSLGAYLPTQRDIESNASESSLHSRRSG